MHCSMPRETMAGYRDFHFNSRRLPLQTYQTLSKFKEIASVRTDTDSSYRQIGYAGRSDQEMNPAFTDALFSQTSEARSKFRRTILWTHWTQTRSMFSLICRGLTDKTCTKFRETNSALTDTYCPLGPVRYVASLEGYQRTVLRGRPDMSDV